jgi:hypothetical protein
LRPIEYFSSDFSWWHRRLAWAAQAKACGYKNTHLNATRYKSAFAKGVFFHCLQSCIAFDFGAEYRKLDRGFLSY